MILIKADARHIPLRDETVQCVVTSPPYWGLRDYGLATWEGGSGECDHKKPLKESTEHIRREGYADAFRNQSARSNHAEEPHYKETCAKCGARRIDKGIGLERTPEEFVANIVAVFREVKRVLRGDGTVWLNLGDSYCSTAPGTNGDALNRRGILAGVSERRAEAARKYRPETPPGLKPKDLVGIPWRVAFALQADGWYLRSDIIWAKPNPMPESVRDRPTKAHEYVFMLSKSQRYYYDQEAVREQVNGTAHRRGKIKMPDGWDTGLGAHGTIHRQGREKGKVRGVTPKSAIPGSGIKANESFHAATWDLVSNRNLRTVWTIATQPFPGAHFATFPEALAERCIKAGTSERGACPKCGAGWKRIVHKPKPPDEAYTSRNAPTDELVYSGSRIAGVMKGHGQKLQNWLNENPALTLGWSPFCSCDAGDPVPCVVLDPFGGSGTVARVAVRLGRRAVHLDLAYHELAKNSRCTQIQREMTCLDSGKRGYEIVGS